MPKDKKNKYSKKDINTAFNSTSNFDDDGLEDAETLPYAQLQEKDDSTQSEPLSFNNIKVTSSDSDDDSNKHIQVTFSEDNLNSGLQEIIKPETIENKQERIKAKKELKKINGSAVSHMIKDKPTKEYKQTVLFGAFITIFVIIGFFTSVNAITTVSKDFINATSLKDELLDVVFPMVIVDIPEFETPVNLESSIIISTAIWSFITDTQKDMTKYQQDDLGSIYVPDVDIEIYVRKLYGSDINIVHQTINDSNIQMIYNEQDKLYIIDSNPNFLPYSPRIDEAKRTGSIYTLTVSYILPTVSWSLSSYDQSVQPADKIMQYRLEKVDENYHYLSVKLLEINDHNLYGSNDTEYIGNYNDYGFDEEQIIHDIVLDEQIAIDIIAAEAEKAENLYSDEDDDDADSDDGDDEGEDEDDDNETSDEDSEDAEDDEDDE